MSSRGRPRRRVEILCEDRRTERFVRGLCKRFGLWVERTQVAPDGKGAASAWVRRQYPLRLRKRRSKNFQRNMGMIVVVDGDADGFAKRKQQLDEQLSASSVTPRQDDEAICVFVPTWSVETWLAYLCGRSEVPEDRSIKELSELRLLWANGGAERATIDNAVEAWGRSASSLPALLDAYNEAPRVGLV